MKRKPDISKMKFFSAYKFLNNCVCTQGLMFQHLKIQSKLLELDMRQNLLFFFGQLGLFGALSASAVRLENLFFNAGRFAHGHLAIYIYKYVSLL